MYLGYTISKHRGRPADPIPEAQPPLSISPHAFYLQYAYGFFISIVRDTYLSESLGQLSMQRCAFYAINCETFRSQLLNI